MNAALRSCTPPSPPILSFSLLPFSVPPSQRLLDCCSAAAVYIRAAELPQGGGGAASASRRPPKLPLLPCESDPQQKKKQRSVSRFTTTTHTCTPPPIPRALRSYNECLGSTERPLYLPCKLLHAAFLCCSHFLLRTSLRTFFFCTRETRLPKKARALQVVEIFFVAMGVSVRGGQGGQGKKKKKQQAYTPTPFFVLRRCAHRDSPSHPTTPIPCRGRTPFKRAWPATVFVFRGTDAPSNTQAYRSKKKH